MGFGKSSGIQIFLLELEIMFDEFQCQLQLNFSKHNNFLNDSLKGDAKLDQEP